MPEKELRRWRADDKACTAKYKKRHLKSLTAAEVDDIIYAAQQPYRHYEDVAKQYKVTAQLVGRLVRTARKRPEKISSLQQREEDLQVKKDAIEDAAT